MSRNIANILTNGAAIILLLSACQYAGGNTPSEHKTANNSPVAGRAQSGEFTAIALHGPDNVVVTTGKNAGWRVNGDAENLETLRVYVEDDTLVIERDNDGKWGWGSFDGDPVTVAVTAPVISQVSLSGSGNIDLQEMHGRSADIALDGSGDIAVASLKAKKLDASIAGSGDITLAGEADDADIAIAGSGNFQGDGLTINDGSISIAGSGDVEIESDGAIDAAVAGSGDVTVSGSATCSKSVIGSGKVNCG